MHTGGVAVAGHLGCPFAVAEQFNLVCNQQMRQRRWMTSLAASIRTPNLTWHHRCRTARTGAACCGYKARCRGRSVAKHLQQQAAYRRANTCGDLLSSRSVAMASSVATYLTAILFAHAFGAFWLLWTWWPSISATARSVLGRNQQESVAHRKQQRADAKDTHATGDQASSTSAAGEGDEDEELPVITPARINTLRKTMSIRVQAVELEWHDIGCSYNRNGKIEPVLSGIYGKACPGEMQALMGPSGAGKSTLMDILAMRKSLGIRTGQLLANGEPTSLSFIRKTAYVPQDDNFIPTMSTKETLTFYADMTAPASWDRQRRQSRVKEVLEAVGLGHRHDVLVGGDLPGGLKLRGLSGGEKKRLAVAAGILAGPAVIFLDEPTSGLDSFGALSVMGYLQQMARAHSHTIITTIHQPRSQIFQMFDRVTLVSKGRLMYYGPINDMVPWFDTLGYNDFDPAKHGVPSDWALDLVAIGFTKPPTYYGHTMRTDSDVFAAADAFAKRQLGGDVENSFSKSPGDTLGSPMSAKESLPDTRVTYPSGFMRQFLSLAWREFLSITRNPYDVAGRTITFCWVGIFMGLLFYNLPTDGTGVRSRVNLLFVMLAFVILMPYISMGLYTADKRFYLADASSKLYRPLAYYLAKLVVTLPFQIVCALVFDFTVYGMAGLRMGDGAMWKNGTLLTLLYLVAVQVLHCSAILTPNQDTAFMVSLIWTTLQMLLASFFISFAEVTLKGIAVFRYISALYYAFEGNALTEFIGRKFSCEQGLEKAYLDLILSALPTLQSFERSSIMAQSRARPGCVVDTNAIIQFFDFSRLFGLSCGILIIYWLGLHVLTYGAMMLAARHERR